jgi:hypothetical protein
MRIVFTALFLTLQLFQSSPANKSGQTKVPDKKEDVAKQPLTVPPLSAAEEPKSPSKEGKITEQKAQQSSEKSVWGDLPTWFLVIVGSVAAWIALRTLDDIKKQTHNAENASEAAKISADAALLNAQAIVNAERAWLTIKLVAGHGRDYQLGIANRGRTPAQVINYQMWVVCPAIDAQAFADYSNEAVEKEINVFLLNGDDWKDDGPWDIALIFGSDWQDVFGGQKAGLIKIRVNYTDLITQTSRESEAVFSYRSRVSRLVPLDYRSRYT